MEEEKDMDEIKIYKPVLLCFIFHVSKPTLKTVKEQVVGVLSKTLADERAYVYSPHNKNLPKRIGSAVGNVSRHKHLGEFSIGKAMKETLLAASLVDEDTEKFVFVITDHYKHSAMRFSISMALGVDKQFDCAREGTTNFVFCSIGTEQPEMAEFQAMHPKVKVIHIEDAAQLGQVVAGCYRREGVILSDIREVSDGSENSEACEAG